MGSAEHSGDKVRGTARARRRGRQAGVKGNARSIAVGEKAGTKASIPARPRSPTFVTFESEAR